MVTIFKDDTSEKLRCDWLINKESRNVYRIHYKNRDNYTIDRLSFSAGHVWCLGMF